ncbi:MAG: glycosyltransferase family 2 protein [Parvularculaceae bacterium]|nr:glycosyltransferase family 2 protein [Parvularculaceae bacterium]
MPRLSVIVVNFNAGARLARCVERLSRQTFKDFELLIVDNGSSDDSIDRARALQVPVVIDLVGANLGFAAANNRAAKRAKGEWLVFLNPDAYAEPQWLDELISGAERYPWADAFGSTQLNADDPSRIDGAGDVFHALGVAYRGCFGWPAEKLPPEGECFSPCAAAAMYRRATFEALGGFDERFFCYAEDVDLGFRLRLSGGRAVQLRGARVLHEGSGVAGRHSAFTVYHGHRNRIWTAYKNLPAELYLATLPLRLLTDLALVFRAVAGGYVGPYIKALADGYAAPRGVKDARREIQKARRASVGEIAAAIQWSPAKLARRAPDIRPIR